VGAAARRVSQPEAQKSAEMELWLEAQIMQRPKSQYSIRECAGDLIRALDAHGGNMSEAQDLAMPYIQQLMAEPALPDFGVPREGNHTPSSSWLYYDYEMQISLASFPKGVSVPVHNHGTWEVVGIRGGEILYRGYRRLDDGSAPGRAELEVVEERVILPGDASVCPPPPHDIHGFTALTDDIEILAIVGGPLSTERQYYDPATSTYTERHSRAWRLGGGADPSAKS
jgi:predicted metal-dependent enzyme (double-stranded beta helix superfamily)